MADSPLQALLGFINKFRGGEPDQTATGSVVSAANQALPAPDLSGRPTYEQGLDRFIRGDKAGAAGFWKETMAKQPGTEDAKEARRGMARIGPHPILTPDPRSQHFYEGGLRSYIRGDHQTAANLWQQALQIDPGNEEARNGLARIGGQ